MTVTVTNSTLFYALRHSSNAPPPRHRCSTHHPRTGLGPIRPQCHTRPHSKAAKRISSFCTPNKWILGGKSSLGHLVEESPTIRSESLVFFVRPTASWKDIPSRAPPRVPMRQALGGSDCSINPRVLRDRGGESVANPHTSNDQHREAHSSRAMQKSRQKDR